MEQPAISAWGLGWEVWLDGQEITQFTYFQQMGGVALDPVSVEITYGLERILIALNNAKAIWNEDYGAGVTYGEIRRQEEFEHSKYYFETADIHRVRAILKDETVAVLGYGVQGRGQSLNMRDNGIKEIVGQRRGGKAYDLCLEDGWKPGETLLDPEEAAAKGTVIQYLLADAGQQG